MIAGGLVVVVIVVEAAAVAKSRAAATRVRAVYQWVAMVEKVVGREIYSGRQRQYK